MTYTLLLLVQNFVSVAQAEFVILSELSRLGLMARVIKHQDTPHFTISFSSAQDLNSFRIGTKIHAVRKLTTGQDMYSLDCGVPIK